MDHELIYAKTAAGERAMLERTRTMPRNVRMVLILVDSRSSVSDLCLKTGNPQMTESALRELEIGGFIEAHRHKDSLWDEEEKLAREIRASAGNRKGKSKAALTMPPAAPETKNNASDVSGSGAGAKATPSSAAPEAARVEAPPAAKPSTPAQSPPAEAQAGASSASSSSIGHRFKELFSKPLSVSGSSRDLEPEYAPPKSLPPPAPRTPAVLLKRKTRSPARRAVLAALAVLAVLILAVGAVLYPYSRFIPELEAAMTSACKRPVRVATLGVEFKPRPAIRLGDVRIGEGDTQVRVSELLLEPTPASLLARRFALGAAQARGLSLPAETLVNLPGLFSELARAGALKTMGRLEVENARMSLGGIVLPALGGAFELDARGQLVALRVASADKALSLALTPRLEGAGRAGLDVVVEAVGWRLGDDLPVLVDTASIEGFYADGVLSIKRFEIRLFDGAISGTAVLAADAQTRVSGELTAKHVNTARLSEALGYAQRLVGDMDGRARFSLRGDGAAIAKALDADGEFSIDRGSVRGIDLSEAARRMAPTPVLGGETKFESLSGRFRRTPGDSRVSELVLNSGLMQSTGSIEVGRDLALSGRLELRTQGTTNQTRIPLLVGGTLRAPSVQVGRSE